MLNLQQKSRKIADRAHNIFVANGVEPHKPTQIAPPNLLRPIPLDVQKGIEQRHAEIEQSLLQYIGSPVFSEPGFILYTGDSCDLLNKLKGSSFRIDLTVTSPPYNIGKEYEEPVSTPAYVEWCSRWMNQVYNLTAPHGAFWLNVGYLKVEAKGLCVPIPYLIWDKSPFYFLQEIVWKYGAGVATKSRLSPRNEKWLFYIKDPENHVFNLDEIRDPNVKYPNQKKKGKFRCNPLGKNPGDVWEFPKVTTGVKRSSKERSAHPAQFPLSVVERIILASSNPLQVILDPFAGSCSAGLAAYGLGRIFVGFEIRRDYCELAIDRFKEFRRKRESMERPQPLCQQTLF